MPTDSGAQAEALVKLIQKTQDIELKQSYAKMLDGIWPGIRCGFDPKVGLCVHYRTDHVLFKGLPAVLKLAADYIEGISVTGGACVMKNTQGWTGPIPYPTRALEGVARVPVPSFWQRLDKDHF